MSALEFRPHASKGRCATPGCLKLGRWQMWIGGLVCTTTGKYSNEAKPEHFCEPCTESLREAWEGATDSHLYGLVQVAVNGSTTEKCDAVDELREVAGFSAERVGLCKAAA